MLKTISGETDGDAAPANDKNAKRKRSDHDSGVSGNQEKRTRSKTVGI